MPSDPSATFSASYDSTARRISTAILVLLAVITVLSHNIIVGCLGVLLLIISYAWSPGCYIVAGRFIIINRLIGAVRVPLEGIREARITTPDDFRDCIRLFGNGGLFGYYGLFRTAKLGKCTWYVTNRRNSVVVITAARTIVVSPDEVDRFLSAVRTA